jgi:predicted dehydrogenase
MITRRSFFLQSTAAMAANQTSTAASDKINIACVGLGIRGFGTFRQWLKMPDVNVVVAIDLYDGHLAAVQEAGGSRIGTGKDYRAVLDRADIDAVVISTPDHLHMPMVIDAVSAGKDVYCEKPLTWAPSEGPKISAAVKKHNRILQVGSQGKSSRGAAKAKELIQSGALGKINLVRRNRCANTEDGCWRYAIPPDASPKTVDWPRFLGGAPQIPWNPEHFFRWRCWWEYSGGVATDLFVHELSMLHYVADVRLPRSVVSHGGIYRWKDGRTVPDQLDSIFEYPDGFQFMLSVNQGNSYGDFNNGLIIMGSEATLVMHAREAPLVLYPEPAKTVSVAAQGAWPTKMREQAFADSGLTANGLPQQRTRREPQLIKLETDPNDPTDNGNWPHLRCFVESVRNRTPSVEDADFGHRAALAAHMATRSYREKRAITFQEDTV